MRCPQSCIESFWLRFSSPPRTTVEDRMAGTTPPWCCGFGCGLEKVPVLWTKLATDSGVSSLKGLRRLACIEGGGQRVHRGGATTQMQTAGTQASGGRMGDSRGNSSQTHLRNRDSRGQPDHSEIKLGALANHPAQLCTVLLLHDTLAESHAHFRRVSGQSAYCTYVASLVPLPSRPRVKPGAAASSWLKVVCPGKPRVTAKHWLRAVCPGDLSRASRASRCRCPGRASCCWRHRAGSRASRGRPSRCRPSRCRPSRCRPSRCFRRARLLTRAAAARLKVARLARCTVAHIANLALVAHAAACPTRACHGPGDEHLS